MSNESNLTSSAAAANTPHSLEGMIRAHIWYGLAGLVLGLAIATALVNMGPEFLRASPFFTYMALGLVMFIGVSMMGGLISIWNAGNGYNSE